LSNFQTYKPYLQGVLLALTAGLVYKLLTSAGKKTKSSSWLSDTDYFTTSKGVNLASIAKAAGITLTKNKGLNVSGYSDSKYKSAKQNQKVYWAVYDIDNEKLVASSSNARKNVYGASVPKILVASAAIDLNGGGFESNKDYDYLIKLLVKSNNDVWTPMQNKAGGADAVNNWAAVRGYGMQPARSKGNNANAVGMCEFYKDVCKNKFQGAEVIFKVSNSCQTSSSRSRKYMPSDVFMGGKTGTYQTSNHDCCWISKAGKLYSICVLTELGSSGSETIAQMFRGLYNEYVL